MSISAYSDHEARTRLVQRPSMQTDGIAVSLWCVCIVTCSDGLIIKYLAINPHDRFPDNFIFVECTLRPTVNLLRKCSWMINDTYAEEGRGVSTWPNYLVSLPTNRTGQMSRKDSRSKILSKNINIILLFSPPFPLPSWRTISKSLTTVVDGLHLARQREREREKTSSTCNVMTEWKFNFSNKFIWTCFMNKLFSFIFTFWHPKSNTYSWVKNVFLLYIWIHFGWRTN